MRKICIITCTRAEYGLLYWLIKDIQEDADLELLRRNVGGIRVMQLSSNVPHYCVGSELSAAVKSII